jgi:hypothetical protein
MNDLCDGVITLGALELLKSFEMLTWLNLDFTKPIAVLNNGFYDALIVLLENDEERLLKEVNYQML